MTSGANFYPPWHVIQPPPGFTPLSYPTYDELFLPRPKFKKFNGNPLEFKSFVTNFETYVEPRVQNKTMLFCLLLQHCANKVKFKMECLGERGEVAYELAKNKLKREFGRPCIIADLCEQQLRDASQVKANDSASLKSFSELLEKTTITLQNLQEQGSVYSLDFMTKLVNKLPFDMQKRWVRESVMIEEKGGHVATFSDFVRYVTRESEEQSSLFGRRVFASKTETKPSNVKGSSEQPEKRRKHGFGVGSARMADIDCTIAQNLRNYQCKRNRIL